MSVNTGGINLLKKGPSSIADPATGGEIDRFMRAFVVSSCDQVRRDAVNGLGNNILGVENDVVQTPPETGVTCNHFT